MLANAWLADLYAAHFGAVFRQCLAHLQDREEAADAAHDVFAKAASFGTPREPGARSQAWLLTVARNHCIDLLRRRHRLTGALLRLEPEADRTSDPERTTIDRQLVHAVLEPLTPRDRRLLWESAVERRPLREIADGLRLSYLATAQALRRARQRAGAIAARVAAVFGVIGLRRGGAALPATRDALLVGVVPLLVISLQSSLDHRVTPSVPPSASAPIRGGINTMPAAIRTSAEFARRTHSAGALPQGSDATPLQPAAAVVSIVPLPPIDAQPGALSVVLGVPSKVLPPSPAAPPGVSVSQAEAALGTGGLPLSR